MDTPNSVGFPKNPKNFHPPHVVWDGVQDLGTASLLGLVMAIPVEFLQGGPDILKPGSAAHARLARRARAITSGAFILTRFPGMDGSRLLVIEGAAGHEKVTCLEPTIDAMFGPGESSCFRAKAADPYASGPSIRQEAMDRGNLFGRHGWIGTHRVLMLWNRPEGKTGTMDLGLLASLLRLDPRETVLTVCQEERGILADFLPSVEPASTDPASCPEANP